MDTSILRPKDIKLLNTFGTLVRQPAVEAALIVAVSEKQPVTVEVTADELVRRVMENLTSIPLPWDAEQLAQIGPSLITLYDWCADVPAVRLGIKLSKKLRRRLMVEHLKLPPVTRLELVATKKTPAKK